MQESFSFQWAASLRRLEDNVATVVTTASYPSAGDCGNGVEQHRMKKSLHLRSGADSGIADRTDYIVLDPKWLKGIVHRCV